MGQEKMKNIQDVPLLLRREIEALIAAPLIQAYAEEIGEERAYAIARKVISKLAVQAGRELASMVEKNDIQNFVKCLLPIFKQDALEVEIRETNAKKARWDTTRCQYAEMYKRHGLEKLGFLLSCGRDAFLFKGYNPKLQFTRKKTCMEGDDCCDFCLEEANQG